MSDLNSRPDHLQRAADALRDAPVPPGPSEELLADTLAALRASSQVHPLNDGPAFLPPSPPWGRGVGGE